MGNYSYSNELTHHGIKGQKWGIRRYQNIDGSLTLAGHRRYGETNSRTLKSGTEIQNISRRQLDPTSKKSNRIYAAYDVGIKTHFLSRKILKLLQSKKLSTPWLKCIVITQKKYQE